MAELLTKANDGADDMAFDCLAGDAHFLCDLFMAEALVAAEAESGLLLGREAGDGFVDGRSVVLD